MVIAEYKIQKVIPLLSYNENKKSVLTRPVPYNVEDEL